MQDEPKGKATARCGNHSHHKLKEGKMKAKTILVVMMVLSVFFLSVRLASSYPLSSTNYIIRSCAFTAGQNISSTSYKTDFSMLEPVIWNMSLSENLTYLGFSYSLNTEPNVSTSSIDPSPLHTNSTLNCTFRMMERDWYTNLTVNLTLWRDSTKYGEYVTYADRMALSGFGLMGGVQEKGETWLCSVEGIDGFVYGNMTNSTGMVVSNSLPEATHVRIISSDYPYNYTTSTFRGEWIFSDLDSVDSNQSTQMKWYKDGTEESTAANQNILTSSNTSKGETWTFSVRVNDGTDWGNWRNASTSIEDTAPTRPTSLFISPTSAWKNTTLTATAGGSSDVDGDSITYYYKWNTSQGGLLQNWSQNTSMVCSGYAACNKSAIIYVWAKAVTAPANSSDSAHTERIIKNSPPNQPAVTLPTNHITTGNTTIHFEFSATDPDAGDTFRYYLFINGTYNSSTTTKTLEVSSFDDGNYEYVIMAFDGTDNSTNSTTRYFNIDTSGPYFSSAERQPATNHEDEEVMLNITVTSCNTIDTVWLVWNGTMNYTVHRNVSTEYYINISAGNYTAHDIVYYEWWANTTAGIENSTGNYSYTIANQIPTMPYLPSLNETSPMRKDMLNCTGDSFADDDAEDSMQAQYYEWWVNNVSVGINTRTLHTTSFVSKGDTVICSRRVNDGYGNSSWYNSTNIATVANTPPTVTSATLIPTVAYTYSTFTCTGHGAGDVDSDSLRHYYLFQDQDGILRGWTRNNTYTCTDPGCDNGDTFSCQYKAFDGTDNSTEVTSNYIVIGEVHIICVRLVLNNTYNNVYTPVTGGINASQIGSETTTMYLTHYWGASYYDNLVAGLITTTGYALRMRNQTTTHSIQLEQLLSGSMVLLPVTKGDWRTINDQVTAIESGDFMIKIAPTFSFGMGIYYPIKIVLAFSDIDIQGDLILEPGLHKIEIQSNKTASQKAVYIRKLSE